MRGQVVVVTGGAQGIGRAIAEGVARAGVRHVAIIDRDAAAATQAAAEISASGVDCSSFIFDLAEADAPARAFAAVLDKFGAVDLLANSAGVTDRGSFLDADVALWDRLYAVNARAPFFLMQAMIRNLRERKAGGAIVNIVTMHAHGGAPSLAVYGSSKASLAALTKNAAHAHRFDRIRVNGICVGWVDTPGERRMQADTLGLGEAWLADAAAQQPFGRLLSAEDVARLALYLLSPESEPMTGSLIDQEQFVIGAFG